MKSFVILSLLIMQSYAGRVCLSSEDQHTACPRGEIVSECNGRCQATCADPHPICNKICVRGCVCPADQLRNSAGICVPSDECPPNVTVAPQKCEANAVWQNCVQGCSDCMFFTNKMIACDPVPLKYCQPGCACIAGYRKDDAGKCVKETECPGYTPRPTPATTPITTLAPNDCPENQVWSDCGINICQGCGVNPLVCKPACNPPGCTCADGYRRNADGDCVLPEDCPGETTPEPLECGVNEFWGPCGHNSCENCLVYLQQAACRPFCVPGCQCLDGHRRNDAGDCIPEIECQAESVCPANEVFDKCNAGCQATCGAGPFMKCPKICRAGCVCEPGYVREKAGGDCIEASECPATTPKPSTQCSALEEFSQCGARCQSTCDNPNPLVCVLICAPGCVCKKPYVRAADNKCVLESQCPPKCTKPNQVYSTCINSCMTCDVLTNHRPCDPLPPPYCTKGCTCADGYRSDGSGNCILASQCPTGSDPWVDAAIP